MSADARKAKARWRPLAVTGALLLSFVIVVALCYFTVPTHNTDADHFDVILVLGTPALGDGNISRAGKWLVDEAAREYQAGRADHVIFSGGAVSNCHREANVLAAYALQAGIPSTAIVKESRARDTLQNISNSTELMKTHEWRSAEVIGLREHLPRTDVLLEASPLMWRTHAAATPGRHLWNRARLAAEEALGTTLLRVFGVQAVPAVHRIKAAVGTVIDAILRKQPTACAPIMP